LSPNHSGDDLQALVGDQSVNLFDDAYTPIDQSNASLPLPLRLPSRTRNPLLRRLRLPEFPAILVRLRLRLRSPLAMGARIHQRQHDVVVLRPEDNLRVLAQDVEARAETRGSEWVRGGSCKNRAEETAELVVRNWNNR
ncbi:hypothetical protein PanWU01x14_155640, partial [Parasponia andersonii]